MKLVNIKFLIDVSAGRVIEKYLREEGYDIKAVRDIDSCMEDKDIIRIAVSEGRMVVTMDKNAGGWCQENPGKGYSNRLTPCNVLENNDLSEFSSWNN